MYALPTLPRPAKVDILMYCDGRIPAQVKLCTNLLMIFLKLVDVFIKLMATVAILTSGSPNSGLQTPVNLTMYASAAGTDDTRTKHETHGLSVNV